MRRARFRDVLAVEATKLARQTSTWVALGILLAYMLVLVIALSSVLRAPQQSGLDTNALLKPLRADALGFVANIGGSIGTIILVVVAAQTMAQEFTRATWRTLLVSRAGRAQVALAKMVVLLLASLVLAIVVALCALAAAAAFEASTGEDLLHASAGTMLASTARLLAPFAVWSLIALGTTLWTGSLGVGLGSTLGGLIAGDIVMGLLRGLGEAGVVASRVMPNAAVGVLSEGSVSSFSTAAWVSANLLAWVVLLNAYAVRKLGRMDVLAATK